MLSRRNLLALAFLTAAGSAHAQISRDASFAILGNLIATEGAARIPMPLGKNGIELSESGVVDREKLQKELAGNGQSILAGKVVSITAIDFSDRAIEFEIDGGGTKKKNFLSNIQVGMGPASSQQQQSQQRNDAPAKGSKITLRFSQKVPPNLSVEQLKDMLNPVLDFTKQSTARAGIDALPPEFREAVVAKKAMVGMDGNTVTLALGAPDKRVRDKSSEGVEQEEWIYVGRGRRQTFVTFEKDVVVSVREY